MEGSSSIIPDPGDIESDNGKFGRAWTFFIEDPAATPQFFYINIDASGNETPIYTEQLIPEFGTFKTLYSHTSDYPVEELQNRDLSWVGNPTKIV